MRTILLATDLSEPSDRALDRALVLAKAHGARLEVLHVVDVSYPASIAADLQLLAERSLRDLLTELPAAQDVTANVQVVVDDVLAAILAAAADAAADLIVVGLHHKRGLRDLFVGTTMERVVRKGERPILVVADRALRAYQRAVVAVDFSEPSRRALRFALAMLPGATFELVHVFELPLRSLAKDPAAERQAAAEARQQLDALVQEEVAAAAVAPAALHLHVMQGDVGAVLQREVVLLHPDLLVLGTRGRSGLVHALLGSVAQALLREPPCDTLAVR